MSKDKEVILQHVIRELKDIVASNLIAVYGIGSILMRISPPIGNKMISISSLLWNLLNRSPNKIGQMLDT